MSISKDVLETEVLFEVRDRVAIITLNRPKNLNAMTQLHYRRIAKLLRDVAKMDDVVVTLLLGRGRFFSAGADVRTRFQPSEGDDLRQFYGSTFVANNLEATSAFASHPKILVTALNGPVVGLSAALVAQSDFIYAAPHTYLLVPFTSLGLVSEGVAAKSFVDRMGLARANEALLMSKRLSCEELKSSGFVNQVLHVQPGEDDKFRSAILHEINERLGPHLNTSSMLAIKRQIRLASRRDNEILQSDELQTGLDRFVAGIPQKEFAAVASGAKRHKL